MKLAFVGLIVELFFFSFARASSVNTITYSGRLLNPSGVAVEASSVDFYLSVYDETQNCLLWSETKNLNMANSKGTFSLVLGEGTRTDGGAHTLKQVFTNAGTLTGLSCTSGSTYSPSSTDDRKMVMSFNDGGGVQTLSAMAVKAVPFAMQADQVSGYGILNLAKISGGGSASSLSPGQYTQMLNFPASSCSTNEILKWNGSAWACSADATGGSPSDSSYAAKGVVQFNTDAATSGISVASGVATVNSGTGANQIVKLDSSARLPAVDGSLLTNIGSTQIPSLDTSKLTSGTLPIARGGTNSATALNSNRLMISSSGSIVEAAAMTDGQFIVGRTGFAPQLVTMSGDATVSNTGAITLSTVSVGKGGTGQSSTFTANSLMMANGTGAAMTTGKTCSLNEILQWDGTTWSCVTLTGTGILLNNGNSFGGAATVGTNDAQSLNFETNNGTKMTILSGGNVGIGQTNPSYKLEVNGTLNATGDTTLGGTLSMTGKITARAPTTSAGTGSIYIPAGTVMTTPEAGAVESNGTSLYFTDSTATRRSVGLQTMITKGTTQTVNNSTTLVNDNAFTFTAVANTRYYVKIVAKVTNNNNAMAWKQTFTIPSGTMEVSIINPSASAASAGSWISGASGTLASPTLSMSTTNNTQNIVIEGYISVGGTGGAVTYQWAQNTAVAANLQMLSGSFMLYQPL